MNILAYLEEQYEIYGLRWKVEPFLLYSDCGDKRLRYWENEQLLGWHVSWRDQLSKNDGFVVDRMIRTSDQQMAVPFDGKWITMHDTAEEPFPLLGEEERWGKLIANILQTGICAESEMNVPVQNDEYDFKRTMLKASQIQDKGNGFPLIRNSLLESKKRYNHALYLQNLTREAKAPLLENDLLPQKGRQIFNFLFFEGGNDNPVRSMYPLRKFLLSWLEIAGRQSVLKLLDCINLFFSLEKEHGLMLLAELLTPRELADCLEGLEHGQLEKMVHCLNQFEEKWEQNRVLLSLVSGWLDDQRKKVAL